MTAFRPHSPISLSQIDKKRITELARMRGKLKTRNLPNRLDQCSKSRKHWWRLTGMWRRDIKALASYNSQSSFLLSFKPSQRLLSSVLVMLWTFVMNKRKYQVGSILENFMVLVHLLQTKLRLVISNTVPMSQAMPPQRLSLNSLHWRESPFSLHWHLTPI